MAVNENPDDDLIETEVKTLTNYNTFTSMTAAVEMIVDPSDDEEPPKAETSTKAESTTKAPSKGNRYPYQLKRMVVDYQLEKLCTAQRPPGHTMCQ